MVQPAVRDRGQYTRVDGVSPFDIFRQYSGQQQQTAEKLARYVHAEILRNGLSGIAILDIGAGTGDFQNLFVNQLIKNNGNVPIAFTWLEPLDENIALLDTFRRKLPGQYNARLVKDIWEEYTPDRLYDVIILSHVLYYFYDSDLDVLFEKMITALKPEGRLLIVARQEDEDFEFIQNFYERVTGQPFSERTIADAEQSIDHIRKKYSGLTSEKRYARSHIVFPFMSNEQDAGKLVEFYLRKKWSDIDTKLQQEIKEYILDPKREGQLQQVDGILIVRKFLFL